ncbi:AAA family ATPase [Anaerosporomusa subterranea]|uniref:AAA family ATPase n=1 Tax=Anaerosporomusa subterranea TaxID=1794912 RepID=A0A154BUM0_ANASB|nr:replication-associated recombination protein A [Anaerosporomusa subterranea]KYZ77555.1 AAA family ATPase [Anaerosporomusa subterranea]
MDLFSHAATAEASRNAPLADRMRPRDFHEFLGQNAVIASGKFLRRMIEADTVPSVILFGPPGTGKTTLALLIAGKTGAHFEKLNAVTAGIADIRKVVEASRERLTLYRKATILFIDEIHRFNKTQQDALLPHVENGTVTLIGATTENPYFEVNAPLLSRARIIRLELLSAEDVTAVLRQALTDRERGLGAMELTWQDDALSLIASVAGGDARVALNLLEQTAMSLGQSQNLTADAVELVAGDVIQRYDKQGDNHYDVASALIKSMRGSDPDAALHYLARMLAAGEDVKFIARRIVICSAEDIGNADPQALVVASAAAQAVQFVGMPEASLILAQAVTYLATAPKSNASTLAIGQALADVRSKDCGPPPAHLRDAHYKGASALGHGKGYLYPHDFPGAWVKQQYLPDKLLEVEYYHPTDQGYEATIKKRMEHK